MAAIKAKKRKPKEKGAKLARARTKVMQRARGRKKMAKDLKAISPVAKNYRHPPSSPLLRSEPWIECS